MKAIEFRKFSSLYKMKGGYFTALSEINLDVNEGELLVVVGESGSGKSTLLKSCLGMAEQFTGELIIDGGSVEDIDLKTGKFSYVKQGKFQQDSSKEWQQHGRLLKNPHLY